MRSRYEPIDRQNRILQAAVQIARRFGVASITRDAVAIKAECSGGLVNHYFGSMDGLRREVKRVARTDKSLAEVLRKHALAALN